MLTLPHIHPAHSACAVHYIKLTPTSYDIEINLQLVEFGHIIIIFLLLEVIQKYPVLFRMIFLNGIMFAYA